CSVTPVTAPRGHARHGRGQSGAKQFDDCGPPSNVEDLQAVTANQRETVMSNFDGLSDNRGAGENAADVSDQVPSGQAGNPEDTRGGDVAEHLAGDIVGAATGGVGGIVGAAG